MMRKYLVLFVVAAVLGVSALWGQEVKQTYLPNDTLGDLNVYLDDMRYLRASYKGVNLFHRWGELYSPLAWGTRRPWGKGYVPTNINDVIIEYLVADIPVRVEKTPDKVEYLWSHSARQSDYGAAETEFLTFPRRKMFTHLQSDYQQVNRLEMTKDRLAVTATIIFREKPSRDTLFFPVLFPGTGKNRNYRLETRIRGKECVVINKDGKVSKVLYPKDEKSDVWITGEPRSLIFDLEGVGKVRYNFSFSDPEASLMFYSWTGWPSPRLSPYAVPAIVGKVVLPTKSKFADGMSKCSYRMEVVVGNAVNELKDETAVKENPAEEIFEIAIEPKKLAGLFFPEDETAFNVVVDGLRTIKPRKLSLKTTVVDYENKEIIKNEPIALSLPDQADKELLVKIPNTIGKGPFALKAELFDGGKTVGFRSYRFNVIDKPYEHAAGKYLMGCQGGWMGRQAKPRNPERLYEICGDIFTVLNELGICRLRFGESYHNSWKIVEPAENEMKDIIPSKKATLANEKGMALFLGSIAGDFPEWAKDRNRKTINTGVPYLPKIDKWEKYCERLAAGYKGAVDTIELENELNLVRPNNDAERKQYIQDYVELCAAAYKGIKKGNPDVLVEGGAMGIMGQRGYMEWWEDVLSLAQSKGVKICDVMAPHYLLSTSYGHAPEDRIENCVLAKRIADKYKLILWNGENDSGLDKFGNHFPNPEFRDDEKWLANISAREALIQKSYGVEHINSCWGVCDFRTPWGVEWMEYENSMGSEYFGKCGWLKPHVMAKSVLAKYLNGDSVFKERVDLGFDDVWAMIYTRGDETFIALWMKEGCGKFGTTLPDDVEKISVVGASKSASGRNDFELNPEPFYLYAAGGKGMELAAAVRKGEFVPDKKLEIEGVKFKDDKKGLAVKFKNYTKKPLKINRLEVRYGDMKMNFDGVELVAMLYDILEFETETPLTKSVAVTVTAKFGDKIIIKECTAVYPSAEAHRLLGELVAVKAERPVKIDGDLSEWQNAVPVILDKREQLGYRDVAAEDKSTWKGIDDLSAVGYLMWDDKNVYFACKVSDDIYFNTFDGFAGTWNCDSIQMAFDPLMDGTLLDNGYRKDDQEINLALGRGDRPVYWRRTFDSNYKDKIKELPDGQVEGAELAVKKWEKGLIYEFKMPVQELYPLEVRDGGCAKFNFIVNDDDYGNGRAKWIGITEGIARKCPALFKKIYFTNR